MLDNIALNRYADQIEARNVGVGGEAGKLRFSADKGPLGPLNHVLAPGEIAMNSVTVPVERLDALVGAQTPTMLKIDVEGFESEVIRGAAQVLAQPALVAVLIELNGMGVRYGFRDSDIHARLLEFGFTATLYDPFHRQLIPLDNHGNSGNTLYVRSTDKVSKRLEKAQSFVWQNISI